MQANGVRPNDGCLDSDFFPPNSRASALLNDRGLGGKSVIPPSDVLEVSLPALAQM